MTVVIGIPASAEHETRSPIVGDVVKKLAGLGARVLVQRGATDAAFATPASLGDVDWVDTSAEVIAGSDVIWTIGNLSAADQAALRPGQVLMGLLTPYASVEHATALAEKGVTAFAMELLPRISRAQSMDILSSQGSASGYQCVLIAAARAPKFFPMLTYAAGTIRPSRALVIGAGVAGLQAIATAKRLGAMVQGYDVRPEVADQVRSVGAHWLDLGIDAAGEGGYARELSAESGAPRVPSLQLLSGVADLTPREREAAQLVSRGMTNRRIAEELGLSVRTVEGHVMRACRRIGVETREDLAEALSTVLR